MTPDLLPIYRRLAHTIAARENCIAGDNQDWQHRHEATIEAIQRLLPSGSGIDSGTTIELEKCSRNRIVLSLGFHHMNDSGMYDGWTQHRITLRPDLLFDFDLHISGPNRNDIKEYLGQTYEFALRELCPLEP